MAPVAAAAGAMLKGAFAGAVLDTEGFRFAQLKDQFHPAFVPGAVKYGDLPALIQLCAPAKVTQLGEDKTPGGAEAVVSALLKLAK